MFEILFKSILSHLESNVDYEKVVESPWFQQLFKMTGLTVETLTSVLSKITNVSNDAKFDMFANLVLETMKNNKATAAQSTLVISLFKNNKKEISIILEKLLLALKQKKEKAETAVQPESTKTKKHTPNKLSETLKSNKIQNNFIHKKNRDYSSEFDHILSMDLSSFGLNSKPKRMNKPQLVKEINHNMGTHPISPSLFLRMKDGQDNNLIYAHEDTDTIQTCKDIIHHLNTAMRLLAHGELISHSYTLELSDGKVFTIELTDINDELLITSSLTDKKPWVLFTASENYVYKILSLIKKEFSIQGWSTSEIKTYQLSEDTECFGISCQFKISMNSISD